MTEQSTNLALHWTNVLHYLSLSDAEFAAEVELDSTTDGCCA